MDLFHVTFKNLIEYDQQFTCLTPGALRSLLCHNTGTDFNINHTRQLKVMLGVYRDVHCTVVLSRY